MAALRIDLQEGFDSDVVAIRVDGKEVYRKSGVTTMLQISLADSVEVDAGDATASVEVEVVSRDARDRVSVDPPAFVAFTLRPDGGIRHQVSKEPFRYM